MRRQAGTQAITRTLSRNECWLLFLALLSLAPPPAPSTISCDFSPSVPATMHTSDAHQHYLQRGCEHDHFVPLRHGAQEHGHVRTHRHKKGVPALLARCRHADSPVVICHRLHTAGSVRATQCSSRGASGAARSSTDRTHIPLPPRRATRRQRGEQPASRSQQRLHATPAVDEGLIEVEDERHFARNNVLVQAQPAASPATRPPSVSAHTCAGRQIIVCISLGRGTPSRHLGTCRKGSGTASARGKRYSR